MSARIVFDEFCVYREGTWEEELPLRYLSTAEDHVHGRLEIWLGKRQLPGMSHFGERDVCFNEWVRHFEAVLRALASTERGQHTLQDQSPGRRAYRFEREGEILCVAAMPLTYSETGDTTDAVRLYCTWTDFVTAVERFFVALRVALVEASPDFGAAWWSHNGPLLPRLRA